MHENVAYALIHSPLVGPFTWQSVHQLMSSRGLTAIIPNLRDDFASTLPYWQQHADSVAHELSRIPKTVSIALIAHSGAGPLLPAIRQRLSHSICAYIFVDAGIPRDALSRLDLMRLENPQRVEEFHKSLLLGEKYPRWNEVDLQSIIPERETRQTLVADLRPRSLSYFSEPIPVYDGWPDAPCLYIKFSEAYNSYAEHAKQADWDVYELKAGHFHMLVEPLEVTDLLVGSVRKLLDASRLR
ncbi:MAG TPA: hypothetical protein VFQ23_06325 [Anaerolineales bacterium]|nr:hypothetical protein [Anaerolineales bacterium]